MKVLSIENKELLAIDDMVECPHCLKKTLAYFRFTRLLTVAEILECHHCQQEILAVASLRLDVSVVDIPHKEEEDA